MPADKMKKCKFCEFEYERSLLVCPECGKKTTNNRAFVFGAVAFLVLLCISIAVINSKRDSVVRSIPPRPTDLPPNAWVIYEVTGSASSVDLTIENESGNTEQTDNVTLPYRKMFAIERGSFVYLSAQNNGRSGTVTCKISIDNQVTETATSSGAFVIASCSGSAE